MVRIGTRGSELARRQAEIVHRALTDQGVASELVIVKTTGDKRLDEPLSQIGAKGLFTKELEQALARGKVDCCVHSLKDLPTESPPELEIVALLERADPRDVLVVNTVVGVDTIAELPAGCRVGTSSLRRRAQLAALRPDVEVVELRGNVPTRLMKVDQGIVHAAIVAAAGVLRLGAHQHIKSFLSPPGWLGAAGQGVIAVQARADDGRLRNMLRNLHHEPTAVAARAERALLGALQGGCQVPIGAATMQDGAQLMLHGMVSDLTGRQVVRGVEPIRRDDPERAGIALAARLRAEGGEGILATLRLSTGIPTPQPE